MLRVGLYKKGYINSFKYTKFGPLHNMKSNKFKTIAFQGESGAYSDLSCRTMFPDAQTLPCHSFEDAFTAVQNGDADIAMIPVDNTIAGRVAAVHHLMPQGNLYAISEHYQPVDHALMAVKGANISDLKTVHSHVHAIPQCKNIIRDMGLTPVVHADTAGAAKEIAERNDASHCAIASELAADIYGLKIIKKQIQDKKRNTTRFLVLSTEPDIPSVGTPTISCMIFKVRNIPAALYKSLGGFATNGLSMTKLESYIDENFQGARFYCEVEGHPETHSFQLALEELGFYAEDVTFLGAFPANPWRLSAPT